MIQKELSSIANLLIEDENYVSRVNNSSLQEISSWQINEGKIISSKPLPKLYFSSLPPVSHPRKSCISLNLSTLLPHSQDHASPKASKSKLKPVDKRERVKITELKSIESLKESFVEPPTRNNFQPFHPPKVRSFKRGQKLENQSSRRILRDDFLQTREKRQSRMVIGLAYPLKYYEKYLVHDQLMNKNRSKVLPYSNSSFKTDEIREFLNKITSPHVRSKSMFSEGFTERITMKNKFLLSPLLKDIN
jgi:hypothetical protein